MVCSFKEQTVHENTRFWLDVCFSREVEASGLQQQAKKCVLGGVGGLLWNAENFPHSSITENGCLENMRNYNFLRQLWLFFGVELMEVNSNLFSRCVFFFRDDRCYAPAQRLDFHRNSVYGAWFVSSPIHIPPPQPLLQNSARDQCQIKEWKTHN